MIVRIIDTDKDSEFCTYTNVKNISTVGIDVDDKRVINEVQHSIENYSHKCELAYELEFYFEDTPLYLSASHFSLEVGI